MNMRDAAGQLVDELLVMEAQSGNRNAFEALVSRWQKRLWQYAHRLTGSSEGAWDVTQESWLGIVRGIRRLNDPARLRPWLYRIVTNKANDWIRTAAQIRALPTEVAPRRAPDGPSGVDVSTDLEGILRQLPVRSRVVLTLYYLEGLGLSEVARVLDVPAGTVKSRLYHARNEFKELWPQSTG
jgi:RNA polymerase sigma-70 factor (ECF subfamily)